jgi:hypothetical protein
LDVSKYGILDEAENSIVPGVVVSLVKNANSFGSGCVRHCAPSGSKYLIRLHTPDRMNALMVSM